MRHLVKDAVAEGVGVDISLSGNFLLTQLDARVTTDVLDACSYHLLHVHVHGLECRYNIVLFHFLYVLGLMKFYFTTFLPFTMKMPF